MDHYFRRKKTILQHKLGGKISADEILLFGTAGNLGKEYDSVCIPLRVGKTTNFSTLKQHVVELEGELNKREQKESDAAALQASAGGASSSSKANGGQNIESIVGKAVAKALAVAGHSSGSSKGNGKRFVQKRECWHCGKTGHYKSECWHLKTTLNSRLIRDYK